MVSSLDANGTPRTACPSPSRRAAECTVTPTRALLELATGNLKRHSGERSARGPGRSAQPPWQRARSPSHGATASLCGSLLGPARGPPPLPGGRLRIRDSEHDRC